MMTDIRDYPEAYQDDFHDTMSPYQVLEDRVTLLQKQLKDALQNAEYAWKNTNLIEKDRQRLMKENDKFKELLNEAYPWVAYWNTNNDALRLCQDIHAVIGERK